MKEHPAYLESDWLRDNGKQLACPDCGSTRDFGPRCASTVGGGMRLYRACKDCGFWQEADGSSPYRTWKSEHACSRTVCGDYPCPFCGTVLQGAPTGELVAHDCGKYLLPSESGYQCTTCAQWRGRETETPWPRAGSG